MKAISNKIWSAILDISPVQFGVYDLVNHLSIYSSGLAEKILGYNFEELQEFSHEFYKELILEEDFPKVINNLKTLTESKEDIELETIYRVKNKAGDIIWVRSHQRVLERDVDGQPIKIITSSEDITELKELEIKLEQEVNALNNIPCGNIQELRIQLNAVTNIMSLFRENHFSGEMDRRLWKYMYDSVGKMNEVLDGFNQKSS